MTKEKNSEMSSFNWDDIDRVEDEDMIDYENRAFAAEFAAKQGYGSKGYSEEW